ncbi:MAG: ErfK/YbiS/YcfS/YnhG family [Beijerinckiaceae bacterium]|nr:MAG: ErfK/YbiS/YcfS/YnhG family [Beijerinckiaceae bacterium]
MALIGNEGIQVSGFRKKSLRPVFHAGCLLTASLLSAALMISSGAFAQTAEPSQAEVALPVPPDVAEATARDLQSVARDAAPPTKPVENPVAAVERLVLPELPVADAKFDDIAPGKPAVAAIDPSPITDKPVELAQPAADAGALDLPEPPAVVVSVEVPKAVEPAAVTETVVSGVKPAESALRLDMDETRLRAMLEPSRTRYRLKPTEIDGFVAAYAAAEFRPFWLAEKGADVLLSPKVEALAAVLGAADQDGLDPVRLVSALPQTRKGAVPAEKRAEVDVQASLAAFLYARDARGGRLEPSRLSALMTPTLAIPAPGEVLDRLRAADARGVEGVLLAYQPQHAGYKALRKSLAKLREELSAPVLTGSVAGAEGAPHPTGTLPANWMEGAPLQPEKADPRVSMLRLRLGLSATANNLYDSELQNAVKAFQRANDLTPNARITPKTRAALENPNAPLTLADRKPDRHALLNAMLANMERWRWLPSDLGKLHVFVNVPDFQLKVMADGAVAHQARVIVGKPATQTPVFSDEMEHLIVNPSWGVPASILKKEFLPKMASDPDYAARRGFQVVRSGNSISIRQPPGERNALGFIKFIFPNQHAVYLHDTPNRSLFGNDVRAFSHGCVRVDKPFALAERLLAASTGQSEQQLRGLIGRGERMIKLTEKIPVHLTYFTVFVDETGTLQQRRDLYGHDARVKNALQL